jgi:hypothetical protein
VGSDGVEAPYVQQVILGEFFKAYWNRRMALDRRNYKQLVQTTVEIAQKVGGSEIINNIVEDLRDENESYRKVFCYNYFFFLQQYLLKKTLLFFEFRHIRWRHTRNFFFLVKWCIQFLDFFISFARYFCIILFSFEK